MGPEYHYSMDAATRAARRHNMALALVLQLGDAGALRLVQLVIKSRSGSPYAREAHALAADVAASEIAGGAR